LNHRNFTPQLKEVAIAAMERKSPVLVDQIFKRIAALNDEKSVHMDPF
jgi:hypothetical protein